ncbi:MAG: serine/threonine protein kinase, partial [bacterium]|nr:serine/threonine protein kinase [bacterium]
MRASTARNLVWRRSCLYTRAIMLLRHATHRIDLERGTRVGAYVVEEVRAQLAHVVVFRARHVVTGRPVALQLLRPTADAAAVRAIQRDLAALNRLRHAHVAEILEIGELGDGRPFLVVEWVAGRSLQTALDERGPLSLDDALPIADELGSALSAAHALGVVHGELHARNVGLVVHGEHQAVKIVNFGMARLSGTRLAPEQSRPGAGAPTATMDRRVDVFALGGLIYQMVTGVRPSADPPPPSASALVPHA